VTVNRRLTTLIAVISAALILAACSHPKVDQRSYHAGYNSAGVSLVRQGVPAHAACQQALLADNLFDAPNYDVVSFDNGCFDAIRADGDPIN
jgi:hypothetical protein